jgi:hypothetical protein
LNGQLLSLEKNTPSKSVYLCQVCFYSWRSTEPTYAVDAEALSKDFRIDPSILSKGQVMPETIDK